MAKVEQLQDVLQSSCEKMIFFAKKANPETELYPGWTVKELIAHLLIWDDLVADALRSCIAGSFPDSPAVKDIDAYNDEKVRDFTDFPLQKVLEKWRASRKQLTALIAKLDSELLEIEITFPWGTEDTVSRMLYRLVAHDSDHFIDLVTFVNDAEND